MLVLTRREGERVLVGDSIVLTVVRVQGDRVRIGIEAPHNVPVLREELLAQSQAAAPRGATKLTIPVAPALSG